MPKIHDLIRQGDLQELSNQLVSSKNSINEADELGIKPIILVMDLIIQVRTLNPDNARQYHPFFTLLMETGLINVKDKQFMELLPQAFLTTEFEFYAKYLKPIFDSKTQRIKLFHSAIYAHNLDLVSNLLSFDPELIKERDARGFTPYKIALAASAVDIETYFYKNFPAIVLPSASLPLDLHQALPASVIIKAAISYENEALRNNMETIIDELHADARFRPLLDYIAASLIEPRSPDYKALRIFISNSDNVASLTPQTKAFGDLDRQTLILRLGGVREHLDMKGSLIHEFTHLVALLIFNNFCKPYLEDSIEHKKHQDAILKMFEIKKDFIKFEEVEAAIVELLIGRMVNYAAKEESLHLPKGSLSIPEWIASIPQAAVLYSNYYIGANLSSIEVFGGPMLIVWNDFMQNTIDAFRSHPMRKMVRTDVPTTDTVPHKIILTTTFEKIKEVVSVRYRYEFDKKYDLVEGFIQGALGQSAIVHKLLFGDFLDKTLKKTGLPDRVSLQDVRILFERLFEKPEYKDCYREIYNLISTRQNHDTKLTLSITPPLEVLLSRFESFPISQKDVKLINNIITDWTFALAEKFSNINNLVDNILQQMLDKKNYDQRDYLILQDKLVDFLYLHIPTDSGLPFDKLAIQISKIVTEELSGTIIKPEKKLLNLFNNPQKANFKIKTDSKSLDPALQNIAVELYKIQQKPSLGIPFKS